MPPSSSVSAIASMSGLSVSQSRPYGQNRYGQRRSPLRDERRERFNIMRAVFPSRHAFKQFVIEEFAREPIDMLAVANFLA